MLFNNRMGIHTTFGGGAAGMTANAMSAMAVRGLPGAEVFVSMEPGGDARIDIRCRAGGKLLFSAEDNVLQVRAGIMTIAQDRDSEVRTHLKGAGFGKVFLDNMLTLARQLDMRRVDMRAGREDGPWYWSYRGARLDLNDVTGVMYQRFERAVRENVARAGDEVLRARVEEILASPAPDANVRLARMDGMVNGRAAGAVALENTNPVVVFDLTDAAQMADVAARMGDMDAARAALREEVARTVTAPALKI